MSKAAHTPRPWFCDDKKGPALGIERQAKETVGVWAQARYDAALALDDDEYDPEYEKWLCGAWGTCSEEDIANARLISAAPDLLAALKRAKEELRLIRMKDTGAVYDILLRTEIDAAIAKAEGRT